MPPDTPTAPTRTQRRVLRTRIGIEDAFIAAVSQRGYQNVSVEDVAEAADVAKATFYAHFANKEALLEAVFARLTRELSARAVTPDPPRGQMRREAVQAVFEHAAQLPDLYRVCLKNAHTRAQYQAWVADLAEREFAARVDQTGARPRAPLRAAALAFAGAHAAILEGWLDGDLPGTPAQIAATEITVTIPGTAAALGVDLTQMGGLQPLPGTDSPADSPAAPTPAPIADGKGSHR